MATVKKKLIVKNKLGLHARPAALFVQIANKFDSDITVYKDDIKTNGKSIMGILMLAAEKDSVITINASGDDAKDAVLALGKIVESEDIDKVFRPASHFLSKAKANSKFFSDVSKPDKKLKPEKEQNNQVYNNHQK